METYLESAVHAQVIADALGWAAAKMLLVLIVGAAVIQYFRDRRDP